MGLSIYTEGFANKGSEVLITVQPGSHLDDYQKLCNRLSTLSR
jgi:hypothetical protein